MASQWSSASRSSTSSPPSPSHSTRSSAAAGNTYRLLARDHAAPEPTLALAKAASLGRGRVRPLAWCSRPRSSAALLEGALGAPVDSRTVPRTLTLLVLGAVLALAPAAYAAGPGVDARAYVVEDGRTGEVLLAQNPARRVPVASLTKLMTVLLTLEHARPTDLVTISPEAAAVGESSVPLRAGEQLTVRDLL